MQLHVNDFLTYKVNRLTHVFELRKSILILKFYRAVFSYLYAVIMLAILFSISWKIKKINFKS